MTAVMIPVSVHTGSRSPQALANEACDRRGMKPTESLTHRDEPGQGQVGRVKAKEPSLRSRKDWLPERWLPKTAILGPTRGASAPRERQDLGWLPCANTVTPGSRRHPPPPLLIGAARGNPVAVWLRPVSRTIVGRTAQLRSGDRKIQEAKATGRKARGTHNPVDRALWPEPKGCCRGSGEPPKDAITVANRRKS
jgi:hypothetical protein